MSSLNDRLNGETDALVSHSPSVRYNSLDTESTNGLSTLIKNYGTTVCTHSIDNDDIIIELKREKRSVSKNARNIILAILNVIFNVAINVSLPIYAGTMDVIGADAYVLLSQGVIWFVVIFVIMTQALHYLFDNRITLKPTASYKMLFVMGFLTTLNGILVVYASPPDRTPPYLQGLLTTTSIPFTVVCRIIWLRKGINVPRAMCTGYVMVGLLTTAMPQLLNHLSHSFLCINVPRAMCTGCVMVGLFITAMPQLWGLPGSGTGTGDINSSLSARVLWPLCFVLGFLPYGIMNVICEKELKTGEAGSFSFITWTQIFQVVTMYMVFWTDFIPGFGMADSVSDFGDRLRTGWSCQFSVEESCHNLLGKSWLFFIAYCLGNLFQYLLIQYAEGAVYASVVQACISPLAALFWTLFKYDVKTDHFYWHPVLTETTAFTFVGVCLIVPAVILYNYFSIQEEKEKEKSVQQKDIL